MELESLRVAAEGSDNIGTVASDVLGLRVVMVNVYGVRTDNGSWTLVDAGLRFSANRIQKWAERHFGSKPNSIFLTHGHFDHIGGLRELADAWDVPVFAHSLEAPYLTGRSKYPPPDPSVGGGAMARLSVLYPRGSANVADRLLLLPQDGSIPGMPGWRWIHTPGHTAGHVSLFRDKDRVLIAGDAFVTTKQESFFSVLTQRPEINGPPAYYTSDWEAAELSVARLAGLKPLVVACGHGLPMVGIEATEGLELLAENFRTWARPVHGRYVPQPALTDERGVVSVPPAPKSSLPRLMLAGAVAGAVIYAFKRRRSA